MWEVLRFFISVAVMGSLIGTLVGWYQAKDELRRDANVLGRCELQHRYIMGGNVVRGTYGDYSVPTSAQAIHNTSGIVQIRKG